MTSSEHPLRLPIIGTTMDVSSMFGIERGDDGLLRAIGLGGRRAKIGVCDSVAQNLAMFWQPDSDDLAWMVDNDQQAEALNEAFQFPGVWDTMAPGEIEQAFERENPDILTMFIPGIVAVWCLADGLFHVIDGETDEASNIGVSAEVAAGILRSWGGLEASAERARGCKRVGSVAAILSEQWEFEALTRGAVMRSGASRPQPLGAGQSRAELLRCLKWAHAFAQGTYETDRSIQNQCFKRWLSDCATAIGAADEEASNKGFTLDVR